MEAISENSPPPPSSSTSIISYPNPPATTIVFSIVCGVLAICIVATVIFLLIRTRQRSNDVSHTQRSRASWVAKASEWRESRKFEPITFAVPTRSFSLTDIKIDNSAISLPDAALLADRYPAIPAPAYTHLV